MYNPIAHERSDGDGPDPLPGMGLRLHPERPFDEAITQWACPGRHHRHRPRVRDLQHPERVSAGAAVQLRLPLDRNEDFPWPIIQFQFTYPRDLTLGRGHTNFVLGLTSNGTECLATQLDVATRLDRDDGVYIANPPRQ
jgi:hypothetical protein